MTTLYNTPLAAFADASELTAPDGTDLTHYGQVSSDPAVLLDLHNWHAPTASSAEGFSALTADQSTSIAALFQQQHNEGAATDQTATSQVAAAAPGFFNDTDDPDFSPTSGSSAETTPATSGPTTPSDLDSSAPVDPLPEPEPEPAPLPADPTRVPTDAVDSGPGGDFYVAVDGNDNGTGTMDDPFASIGQAVSVAAPGDVILVRGGTYEGPVNIWNGGTPGADIEIRAFPGETPLIDGANTAPGTDLVVISASNVVFAGFEVANSQKCGIAVWAAQNVTIQDNVVHSAQQGGIWIGADRPGISSGHLIEGNAVYDTALSNQDLTASGGWPRAIGIDVSSDTIVQDNYVFENYGEGIGALSSTDILITGNFAYDNYSVQIYLDNVQDVTATDNFVFHTFDAEFFRDGEPGIGILIANEYTQYEMPTTGLLIEDNSYAGVETAHYDGSYGWGGGMTDSTIGDPIVLASGDFQSDWLWA